MLKPRICAILLAASALWAEAAVKSAPDGSISHTDAAIISECADLILEGLGSREWLVANGGGFLTDAVLKRAGETGRRLYVAPLCGNFYGTDLRKSFETGAFGMDSPRLAAASAYGAAAFVNTWIGMDCKKAMESCGFLMSPELFNREGWVAVPSGLVVSMWPAENVTKNFLEKKYGELLEAADRAGEIITGIVPQSADANRTVGDLRTAASFACNMMGAALYNAGMLEEAYSAFDRSWTFNKLNLPAFFNITRTVQRGIHPERGEWLKTTFEEMGNSGLRDNMGADALAMSALSGYLVDRDLAEVSSWEGWEMMTTAIPGVSGNKAADIFVRLKNVDSKEEKAFRKTLNEIFSAIYFTPPDTIEMLDTIAACGAPDYEKTMGLIFDLLRKNEIPAALKMMETAGNIDSMAVDGRFADFVSTVGSNGMYNLPAFLNAVPESVRGRGYWMQCVLVCDLAEDLAGMADSSEKLIEACGSDVPGWLPTAAAGWKKIVQNDFTGGLELLEKAFDSAPEEEVLYRTLIVGYMAAGHGAEISKTVGKMLKYHPDSPWPNYIMAAKALAEDNYAEAEKYFDRIFNSGDERIVNLFMVNDYAMMLAGTGHGAEAENLVRQYIKLSNNKNAIIMDTLATAVRSQGKRDDEALELYLLAAEMPGGDDPRIQLNAAEMLIADGQKEKAAGFLKKAAENFAVFSDAEKIRFKKAESDANLKLLNGEMANVPAEK